MRYFILLLICCSLPDVVLAQFSMKSELKNLGRKVNTVYHEAAPVVNPEGNTLYFFVNNHPENTNGKEGSQDIWYSELQPDGTWGEPKHIGKPLNQNISNQVFNILPDGRLFIRGGKKKNSRGFSFTRKTGSDFTDPEPVEVEELDKMNNGKFYGATISTDGRHMIIYMSEKPNNPFSDLYISHLQDNGKFSIPVALPTNINTGRDEFGPFLAPDDKTLYFSSNRKDMGLGSADIYKVTRLDDSWTKWSDPVNMGRPINTSAFDAYLSVDNQNNVFVTMAGDPRDGGNLDIFQLVPKNITITMKGLVFDEETRKPLDAHMLLVKHDTLNSTAASGYTLTIPGEGEFLMNIAREGYSASTYDIFIPEVFNDTVIIRDFSLIPEKRFVNLRGNIFDEKTQQQVLAHLTIQDDNGGFYESRAERINRTLEQPGWYYIAASAEGYLNSMDSVFYDGENSDDIEKDIYLTPIEVGATVRLDNIYFDFDKTTLQQISYKELDKVVEFLKSNPNVEIEIAGHTDSKGADDYNLNLSQGRAQAVVDYLISQGIDDWKLKAQGYGESKPLATNETDEGRAENRRVEFTILKK